MNQTPTSNYSVLCAVESVLFPLVLLLVLADAKEREKFCLNRRWLLPVSFPLYVGAWLLGFAAAGLCEFHLQTDAHRRLLPADSVGGTLHLGYKFSGYLVLAAWWQFWISHHFRVATVLQGLAAALGTALSILYQVIVPPSLLVALASMLWPVLLLIATLAHYNFAVQHLNHKLGARDLGRLDTPAGRLSANPFVLPQTPDLFVAESIESQRDKFQALLSRSSN